MSAGRTWFGRRARLALFFGGTMLSIGSWFLDRATSFPVVLRAIAPEYVSVAAALDVLDRGESAVVPIRAPGAQVILSEWSPVPPETYLREVTAIGRSAGVFNMNTGLHHYELRLITPKGFAPDFISTDAIVKKRNADRLASSSVRWSGFVFAFGTLLSSLMMLLEWIAEGEKKKAASASPSPMRDDLPPPPVALSPADMGTLAGTADQRTDRASSDTRQPPATHE